MTSASTSAAPEPTGAGPADEDWLVTTSLAPHADGSLAPLYAGAARGELTLPFCGECGLAVELEQRACDSCGSTYIDWRAVERVGVVHAATLVHRREPGLIRATGPYPVLDVEVASGHRLVMTTVTASDAAPVIGQPVAIGFRTVGGVAVPAAHLGPFLPASSLPTSETEVST